MKTIDFSFDNVGGMSRLYLIGRDNVRQVAWHHNRNVARLSLVNSSAVYCLNTTSEVFSFSEKLIQDEGGDIYDVSICGFLPRLDNLADFTALERGEWLAVHQDANGCIFLSGTQDVPLRFSGEKTILPRNGLTFELAGKEAVPSIEIDHRAFYI